MRSVVGLDGRLPGRLPHGPGEIGGRGMFGRSVVVGTIDGAKLGRSVDRPIQTVVGSVDLAKPL